ncbi:MAG TPA: Nudix family hydrolase [Gammaproteobacteria bacterium]|nr:Nudix family hydrolase [Gammaproteobacteria bacterium]
MEHSIKVVAGVLQNETGEILLAQRPPGKPMPGRWEFPGGKIHNGEAPTEALTRELREEMGIEVEQARALIRLHHDYPALSVDLDIYRVEKYSGEPQPLEDQQLAWARSDALSEWDLLEADRPIVAALQLPDRCWVTPPFGGDAEAWLRQVDATLKSGIPMLQCRLETSATKLARAVRGRCREQGTIFIWNGEAGTAEMLAADGLHLSARELMALETRPSADGWIGASCHTEGEIRQANRLGLDYIFIGTVQATPSHPGGPTLGWEGFECLAGLSNLPAYAIGGMTVSDVERVQALGGQGIAAIRSLM